MIVINGPRSLHFAFDVHGVIDARPELFSAITHALRGHGHFIHIVTGPEFSPQMEADLKRWDIAWTHFFSIVGYHKSNNTDITYDERGPHIDTYLWDRTKADYCKRENIVLHFDDSDSYNYFFKTPYARFFAKDSERVKKIHL